MAFKSFWRIAGLIVFVVLISGDTVSKPAVAQTVSPFGNQGNPYTNLLIGPPIFQRDICHIAASECLTNCTRGSLVSQWGQCRALCRSRLSTCRQGQQSLYERRQRRLDSLYENGFVVGQLDLNRNRARQHQSDRRDGSTRRRPRKD